MVRLLATEPGVWAMAEQMLGEGQLVQPERIRGIYCTLPYGDHPPQTLGCHTDGHPFHLGVVGYIDDVPPGGGSFMVWPESHRAFYPTFTSQYLRDNDEAAYEKVRLTIFNERPPVDTHGQAGDIVFWHHRLGHMASPNTSRQLRQAVLYDYVKKDIEETQQEPLAGGDVARLVRGDAGHFHLVSGAGTGPTGRSGMEGKVTEGEILKAQEDWAAAIVAIGAAYAGGKDYRSVAEQTVDALYGYAEGPVLFKPTKASEKQFRLTREEAVSYFVTGAVPEDHGFAIQPWSAVRFENAGFVIDGGSAIAMGNYYFTDANTGDR